MPYKFLDILKGGVYEVLNINGKLKDERIKNACSKCYAYHNDKGEETGYCNSKRNGCACKMSWKGRIEDVKCVQGIFYNNVINEDRLEEFNAENNFKKK